MQREIYEGSFEISPEIEAERENCRHTFKKIFDSERPIFPRLNDFDFDWMVQEALQAHKRERAKRDRLPAAGRAS